MSSAYDECQYYARTLAISLLDLDVEQQNEILGYLLAELERLRPALMISADRSNQADPLSE